MQITSQNTTALNHTTAKTVSTLTPCSPKQLAVSPQKIKVPIYVNNQCDDESITKALHESGLAPLTFTYKSDIPLPTDAILNYNKLTYVHYTYKLQTDSLKKEVLPELQIAYVPRLTQKAAGIFAVKKIKKGTIIGKFIGETKKNKKELKLKQIIYTMEITPPFFLDFNTSANWTRFLNGSETKHNVEEKIGLYCELNEYEEEQYYLLLKATKYIEAGEQLLLDYVPTDNSEYTEMGRPGLKSYIEELEDGKIPNPEQNNIYYHTEND